MNGLPTSQLEAVADNPLAQITAGWHILSHLVPRLKELGINMEGCNVFLKYKTVTVRSVLLRFLGIGEMHCIFVLFMPICDCLLSVKF